MLKKGLFKDDSETPDDSADQPWAKIRDDLYAAKGVVENTSSTSSETKAAALRVVSSRTGLRKLPQDKQVRFV
jgi:hypothetical protein